ncbi:MAG: FkbM family methyltransferase [Candidatus Bathyarchaeia archaeon]
MTFVNEQYSALNVKGKVVADVGASYGDTTIYFALKGARKVYAYEPIPWVVKLLKKNIKYNHLTEIVEIRPYAVSSTDGKARITIPKVATDAASLKYTSKENDVTQVFVKTVTLPVDVEVVKQTVKDANMILYWIG